MSTTKHLGLRDAVKAAYAATSAITAVVGAHIHGNRDFALPTDVLADIQVLRVSSGRPVDPEEVNAYAPIEWLTVVRTKVRARGDGSATAEARADSLLADAYAALFADPSLGGLAQYTVPLSIEWDQDEGDTNVVSHVFDVGVRHVTRDRTLTN